MLDTLITCATALFLANFWSQWRYRFFDYSCAVAAIVGAFALPALAERLTPALADLGLLAFDAGGALIGCLVDDAAAYGRG
jgi:hypothetical protein